MYLVNWPSRAWTEEEITLFREAVAQFGLTTTKIHRHVGAYHVLGVMTLSDFYAI
jgi:hypothetical protein